MTARPLGWMRSYAWGRSFGPDALAGIALAALLIPESIGYAGVAGLPPQAGLFAAPLALIGYAVFGGSRVAVVAAASAVSAVSASVVGPIAGNDPETFIALSAWLAILSGLIYIATGLLRMGWIANFMSRSVVDGFVMGLAVYIIAGQVDELVGIESEGDNAVRRIAHVVSSIGDWHTLTLAIGIAGLALLFALAAYVPKLPGALVLVAAGMAAIAVFGWDEQGVQVIGELPSGLPPIGLPSASAQDVLALLAGAAAVTLVGFSEGFAAVKAYSGDDPVDVDREVVAFGVANIGAGVSSGMVVGSSLSKTAALSGAGATSQMANIVAAIAVIATLLVLGPLFEYLPETILAAVVIHAVWGLIDTAKLRRLWRLDRFDFAMAALVFCGTLLLEPIYAVLLGVGVSLIYLIYRVSFPYRASLGLDAGSGRPVDLSTHPDAHQVPDVLIYRMDAPLLYVNSEAFASGLLQRLDETTGTRAVIIDCEAMFTIDATGLEVLEELVQTIGRRDTTVALARVRSEVAAKLDLAAITGLVGEERIYDRVEHAVADLSPTEG